MNSKWVHWADIERLDNIQQPGVYFVALSKKDISGKKFRMIEQIIYVGMTTVNLKQRLNRFFDTMRDKPRHGGAMRVKLKHKNEKRFFKNCFVSILAFPKLEKNSEADNLRIKGKCMSHEYFGFADYMEKFGRLPEFNDQKRSRKR